MTTRILFPAALFLLLLQMSCAAPPMRPPPVLPAKDPESLQPQILDHPSKKVYNLNFFSAWNGTLQSLRETNMPLTVQDREKGIIRTDYIKGAEFRRLEKAFSSRYKYNILLSRESETRTALHVRCLFEIKEKNAVPFGGANDLYPDEVTGLEDELRQIIESTLRRVEAARPAGSKTPEREKAPPPARQVAPVSSPSPKIFLLTKKNAHLRESPSAESKIILTFKPGRKVEKIEESGIWVRVRIWETTTGWIQKDFLEEAPP